MAYLFVQFHRFLIALLRQVRESCLLHESTVIKVLPKHNHCQFTWNSPIVLVQSASLIRLISVDITQHHCFQKLPLFRHQTQVLQIEKQYILILVVKYQNPFLILFPKLSLSSMSLVSQKPAQFISIHRLAVKKYHHLYSGSGTEKVKQKVIQYHLLLPVMIVTELIEFLRHHMLLPCIDPTVPNTVFMN